MPYRSDLSIDFIRTILDYDPLTGVFTWKARRAKNVAAGSVAGTTKPVASGRLARYIKIERDIPASRIAWAMHYGEWPAAKLSFKDNDPTNLRIDNLVMMNSLVEKYDHTDPEQRKSYLRDHRKAFPKAWKNTHLMSSFGISLSHYVEMKVAQGGVCAICRNPETHKRGNKIKDLAVDHCHKTGKVRGLLCSDCNTGIGKLKDSPEILDAAAAYLRSHGA